MTLLLLAAENAILTDPVLPAWAQWIVLIGGVTLAVQRIWQTVVRPIAKIITLVDDVQPILDELITEFRPNHGSSLYDTIHRIDRSLVALQARVKEVEDTAHTVEEAVFPDAEKDILDAIAEAVAAKIRHDEDQ